MQNGVCICQQKNVYQVIVTAKAYSNNAPAATINMEQMTIQLLFR
jgi:hypothetical protein